MKTLKISALIVLSLILGTACEKDNNEESVQGILRFRTEMTSGLQSQKFNIGDTIQIGNYDFNLKKFKLYLSNIRLMRNDSTFLEIRDILLADVGDDITGQFSVNLDPDEFTGLYLGYGLDTAQNNSIPESFERDDAIVRMGAFNLFGKVCNLLNSYD